MTIGIGGSDRLAELARLRALRGTPGRIEPEERVARIARLQELLRAKGHAAAYLDASSTTLYFTGVPLSPSERLHGVVVPAAGGLIYVTPAFEQAKLETMIVLPGDIRGWEEDESPTALVAAILSEIAEGGGTVACDPATPLHIYSALVEAAPRFSFVNGGALVAECRMRKSPAEIAIITQAMQGTLEVQRSVARILRPGISTREVQAFIAEAHAALGIYDGPPAFSIVLFGEPTAYPHGVPYPQTLQEGDMVLVDTGARCDGYFSDLTRSYVFGKPSEQQRFVWETERRASDAAFAAARLGAPCEAVDAAARQVVEEAGFGPGYRVPGLPHRTGHGLGLDVHEDPYIVRGNRTALAPGMCFSIEPMICLYGAFGVRLEDHVYMTPEGPAWFTEPSRSIDAPFGE